VLSSVTMGGIVKKIIKLRDVIYGQPFTYVGLPELTLEEFSNQNFSDYIWIHFEGRNVENVALVSICHKKAA